MIRRSTASDMRFILSAWVRGFSDSDVALTMCPRDGRASTRCGSCGAWSVSREDVTNRPSPPRTYTSGQHRLASMLLTKFGAYVSEAGDGLLDGFVVSSGVDTDIPSVHYVYVRRSARGTGVARSLVGDLYDRTVAYTHRSRNLDTTRLPTGWRYDPYRIYWDLCGP